MTSRGRFQGLLTIARLNWSYYFVALLVLLVALMVHATASVPALKLACAAAAFGSAYFVLGSLGVSYVVYDRSDLYRWKWLSRALGDSSRKHVIVCHTGFDESSESLRHELGSETMRWIVLDHFDATRMTEPSIRRARELCPPAHGIIAAAFDRWPTESESADLIFALLAIHELRSEPERIAWFIEAKRCLRPHGRIILVEHTRDLPNLLAFGPGFLHFHSTTSWCRCWSEAGLKCVDTFKLTPWLRVCVIGRP
jgi:SAM-dependent methyltransferase